MEELKGIKYYSEPDEIKIRTYAKGFNKYTMLWHDIGGDMNKYSEKLTKIVKLIEVGNKGDAIQEIRNLSMCAQNSQNEFLPQIEAFKSIMVNPDENIDNLTIKDIEEAILSVKKKSMNL